MKSPRNQCLLAILCAGIAILFFACSSSVHDDPDAQVPKLTGLSDDVRTVLHVPQSLLVSVTIEDAGTLSYQWYVATSKLDAGEALTDATEARFVPATTETGTLYYYCVITNRLGKSVRSVTSPRITYTVTDSLNAVRPVIVQQPEPVTADFGKTYSLSVQAYASDGGTLSYQWYFKPAGMAEDDEATELAGENNATFSATISTDTIGGYYCVVTNTIEDNGDGGLKSADITTDYVEVLSTQVGAKKPIILRQPQNVTLDFGSEFLFEVTAYAEDEGALAYQWYYKSTESGESALIDGAEEAVYSGTTSAQTVGLYYCVVTNRIEDNGDGGEKTAETTTSLVRLSNDTINANAPIVFSQVYNSELSVPQTLTLSVSAHSSDGGALSYQWYILTDGVETEIAGETAAECTVTAQSIGSARYWCVVTNTIYDNGDGGIKSQSVSSEVSAITVVRMNAETPVITVQPLDDAAIIPAIKVFSVGAYVTDGGALTYQWYAVSEGDTDGREIVGETSARLKVTTNELGKTGYYCVVTNTIEDNGDGGTKSKSVQSNTAWFDAVYLKGMISAPEVIVQPTALNIAPSNQAIELQCQAESARGTVSYRWYKSADGTAETGTAVTGATASTLTLAPFTKKGIYYYYCVATTVLSENDDLDIKSAAVISDVVSVAYTGLPVVSVETPDRVAITSKDVWTKNATISVCGANDESWNFDEVTTSIRGRGNTTWLEPKKPYALKLDKKQKIFGLPKHKRWVLIANYLDNSFMRNEMAFYLSEQVGLDWTVHGEFVDLVLNGEYKGLYWLGEAIKVDENRVNINDGDETMTDDEDKDYLIEMDVYYDEVVKFHSSIRGMPYMIKNDDYMIDDNDTITSGGEARLTRLQEKITALEEKLYPADNAVPDESYSEVLDIDSWAKFWFVNEIMNNFELGHPKSCYFTFDSANNVLKAGPVWDFDWAALQQDNGCVLKNTIYYNALFKSPTFVERTKALWAESYAKIDIGTQIEAMREQLAIAAEYDARLWAVNHNPSGLRYNDFDGHVNFLKDTLQKKLAVVNADVSGL